MAWKWQQTGRKIETFNQNGRGPVGVGVWVQETFFVSLHYVYVYHVVFVLYQCGARGSIFFICLGGAVEPFSFIQ